MSIFKSKSAADEYADSHRRAVEYTRDVLDPMAVEAEAKLRADNPDLLARFEAEHQRQCAGFGYSFKRHGDFLTISLTRDGNQDSEWAKADKRWAKTINLGLVRSITLSDGHAADCEGSFGWSVGDVHLNDKGEECGWGSSSGRPTGPSSSDRFRHRVLPGGSPDWVRSARSFASEKKDQDDRHQYMSMSMGDGVTHRTTNFPRESEDDSIRFQGIGLSIHAPFGLGSAMHEALLAELAADAPA
jgi:hypothetical protein